MKKIMLICLSLLLPAITFSQIFHAELKAPLKICVISDAHLYDTTLGISGKAFQAYLSADRKLIAESESILKSAVQIIKNEAPSVLLVPGDLTKDGEKLSHQKFAAYLKSLKDQGIRCFVVPGNHDVMNFGASSYRADSATAVDHITPDEFASIYADNGYAAAIARDANSLSYVVELADGLWLFGLDACRYKENTVGYNATYGKFSPETLVWIKAMLLRAKSEHKTVIGMMHHGLVEHYTGQKQLFPEYVVDDFQSVARMFTDNGMKLVFTGHYHAQDITKYSPPMGSSIYDIETGSLVTYPSPIRVVTLGTDLHTDIRTLHVENIDYNTNGVSFPEYSQKFLLAGLSTIAQGILLAPKTSGGYGLSAEQTAQVAPLVADAFRAHYAGDEAPSAQTLATIGQFINSGNPDMILMGKTLATFWTDLPPADNTTSFSVRNMRFTIANQGAIVNNKGVDVLNSGYGSSMAVDPNDNSAIYLMTDRGPNADAIDKSQKVFPVPSFNPHIGRFVVDGDSLRLVSTIELKDATGRKLTGLPNLPGFGGTNETGIDLQGVILPTDSLGIDPEGMVALKDGTFWVSDEYGPHIIHFDAVGRTIERINPFLTNGRGLPKVFSMRRPNRGMEGLTITPDGKKLVGMMQSPLYNPSQAAVAKSLVTRLLIYDIATAKTAQYAYVLETTNTANSEIAAISDSTFLVLERDPDYLYGTPKALYKSIYKIGIRNATDLTDPANGQNGRLIGGKTIEQLNTGDTLKLNGIIPVSKTLVVNLVTKGYMHDKAEGLAIISDRRIAISNDDDFGILGDGKNGIIRKMIPTSDTSFSFVDCNQVEFIDLEKSIADITTGVNNQQPLLPTETSLEQNYPNPFNPTTSIVYHVAKQGPVTLRIYDLLGRMVREMNQGVQAPGHYRVRFDASSLSSGLYIYRLQTDNVSICKKMFLLK